MILADLLFSDKKIEYVFFDIPNDKIEVLAAHINQFRSIEEPSKELIKQILQQHIEKKKVYATLKNV